MRIGFVWLELVKVSFSRASARRRHKSIENWIMLPRSGKSKVTGDEVWVTSLWAVEFSRQCYAILLSRNSAESSEQFSVFRHQRNGTVHDDVWVCGWSTQYENTMEMHQAQQFQEISMGLRQISAHKPRIIDARSPGMREERENFPNSSAQQSIRKRPFGIAGKFADISSISYALESQTEEF